MRKIVLIYFFWFYAQGVLAQSESLLLNKNWRFRNESENGWKNAVVPGNIHLDLFREKIISDPFIGNNEKMLQWIDTCNWYYQAEFEISQAQSQYSKVEMSFEGIDTYANVFLNDSLIFSADNMFRQYNIDVRRYLKVGKNKLSVNFISAVKTGKQKEKQLTYVMPGEEKVFTRKAQYQYGWDWAPRFVTCGLWKPVRLILWNQVKIENVFVNPDLKSDSLAVINYEVRIQCEKPGEYEIENNILGKARKQKQILKPGVNTIKGSEIIRNPRIWWSNGLGTAELYQASFVVYQNETQLTSISETYGIRKVELVQTSDSIGSSFFFRLNGKPVFMKGANFVPLNSFLPSVAASQYKNVVKQAIEANMNMLRVWGGGVYEDDEFYAQCDSNGILVWQDFMFACSMYPGDDLFMASVEQEAIDNVTRLRNHPCIALWCGNNEVSEGWHNWGWQKQYNYSRMVSFQLENDYENLFENVLPGVVRQYHPSVNYWPSSPFIGWGRPESLKSGDLHYWGVWWGHEPFERYKSKVGRFVSEYGFQSYPDIKVVRKYFLKEEADTASAFFKNHQKHPTGFETINEYLLKYFRKPNGLENYIYTSQLLQAEGMRIAIEAHRRAMPYCMGSLYWQLNDCWPSISWSTLDYSGNWKASHYAVRKSFETIKISMLEEEQLFRFYAISDSSKDFNATLLIRVKDFHGKLINEFHPAVKINASTSSVCFSFSKNQIVDFERMKEKLYVETVLVSGANTWKDKYFFVLPRELALTSPSIQIHKLNANAFEVTTDVFAKSVYVQSNIEEDRFSDNYFDLAPSEKKIIYLKNTGAIPVNTTRNLISKSLTDTYQP